MADIDQQTDKRWFDAAELNLFDAARIKQDCVSLCV